VEVLSLGSFPAWDGDRDQGTPLKLKFASLYTYLGFCVFALCISTDTSAGVVFSNFGPGLSYDTSTGNVVGDGFDGNVYAQGGSFTPGANTVFGSLVIALSEFLSGSQGAPVTIALTADAGNTPGAVLESWSIAPGSLGQFGNNNAPIVLNSNLNLALLGGTEYWITASLGGFGNTIVWNLNSTGDLNDEAINDGTGWFSPSGLTPGAFQVDSATATVPEPSTLALASLAIAGFAFFYRRKLTLPLESVSPDASDARPVPWR